MRTLLGHYCTVLRYLTACILAVMVGLVFTNVVMRYVFNSGIAVSEELSRWLFVWLTLLGSIYALRDGTHLGTEIIISRVPPMARRSLLLVGHLLMLWICWLLFSGASFQVQINWGVSAPTSGFPVAWFYLSGVVFSVSAALILVEQMIGIIFGRNDAPAISGEQP